MQAAAACTYFRRRPVPNAGAESPGGKMDVAQQLRLSQFEMTSPNFDKDLSNVEDAINLQNNQNALQLSFD